MINRELLAAVLGDIDADAPRLVYADWLEENGDAPRAEFIRLQCQIESCGAGSAGRAAAESRCKEILVENLTGDKTRFTNEAQWIAQLYADRDERPIEPPIPFRWWTWRRGFVESATIRVESLPYLMRAAELTPITQIAIYDYDPTIHNVFGWTAQWPSQWLSGPGLRVRKVLIPGGTRQRIGTGTPGHFVIEELPGIILPGTALVQFMGAREPLGIGQRVTAGDRDYQIRAADDTEEAIGRVARLDPESGTVDVQLLSGWHAQEGRP